MSVRRVVACLALVLCASWSVRADDAEIKKTAKASAEACQNAFVKGEYDKFIDLTHPKIVEEVGGRRDPRAMQGAAGRHHGEKGGGVAGEGGPQEDAPADGHRGGMAGDPGRPAPRPHGSAVPGEPTSL